MAKLKESERAARRSSHSDTPGGQASPQSIGAPLDPSNYGMFRTDTLDDATLARSSGSSFEKRDLFMFGQTTNNRGPPNAPAPVDHADQYHPSHPSLTRFMPGIRNRQGTSLTTSTNFSVGSTREAYRSMQQKLKANTQLGHSDFKDIFRLLKRFTISNDGEGDGRGFSPSDSAGPHRGPAHADLANYQEEGVTSVTVANYPLPGHFIGTEHSRCNQGQGRDSFGNTIYHELAVAQGSERQLIHLVSELPREQGSLLNVRNTGAETFLHVLHDKWFEKDSPLRELVDRLRETQFNFYAQDAYGRTFFHLLRQKYDVVRMREITRQFNLNLLNTRDAFGVRPMIARASTMTSRQEGPARLTIPSTDRSQERIRDHTKLLKIITEVNSTAQGYATEDNQGRNALHCLAEVILGSATMEAHANGTRAPKRRMDDKDEPELQVMPLSKRLQYLETVLLANVDVNHYNTSGDTVLMAFVTHITDGQDDKDLEQIIKRLIAAGANLEARNRNGETVLQVAARLGQKFAVRVLVEQGANVHVRNCEGRSVLQMVDGLTKMSQEWPEQIARLEATRVVLTGRYGRFPAEQDPTPLQEWGLYSNATPAR